MRTRHMIRNMLIAILAPSGKTVTININTF